MRTSESGTTVLHSPKPFSHVTLLPKAAVVGERELRALLSWMRTRRELAALIICNLIRPH
jgi:hypothetical protein